MPAHRGRRRKGEPPAYLRHKSSGLAYVHIDGHDIYLGEHGTPESLAMYHEAIRSCTAKNRRQLWKRLATTLRAANEILHQIGENLPAQLNSPE